MGSVNTGPKNVLDDRSSFGTTDEVRKQQKQHRKHKVDYKLGPPIMSSYDT